MSCVFCQIINGEIPAHKIYEDDQVLAFLDIAPVSRGHTLVIPKKHLANLLAMTVEEAGVLFQAVYQVARAIDQTLQPSGINIGMNNGRGAGQIVDHAHIHIMPRFGDDGLKLWPSQTNLYQPGEAAAVAQQIKDKLVAG